MCQKNPGPRCANHTYKEYMLAKEKYETLVAEKATPGRIQSARKKMNDALFAYATTPSGRKHLVQVIEGAEAEGKTAQVKRLKEMLELADNQREQTKIRWKAYQKFEGERESERAAFLSELMSEEDDLKEDPAERWRSGYKQAVGGMLVEKGEVLKTAYPDYAIYMTDKEREKAGFGTFGRYTSRGVFDSGSDYEATSHLKTCGTSKIGEIRETSWEEGGYTMDEDIEQKVGVEADMSCRCGNIHKRAVRVEGTLTSVLQGILNG